MTEDGWGRGDAGDAVVRVRADGEGFAREVAAMRDALEGSLGAGAERGGRAVEGALLRAARSGRLGFDELRRAALAALDDIAAGAVRAGIGAVLGGAAPMGGGRGGGSPGGGGLFGGGLASTLGSLLTVLAGGAPGRATGGPVAPGRAYRVGERGPELFVPTASGRVVPGGGGDTRPPRDVRVSITVAGGAGAGAPEALARSGRQVARAVRAALRED